mgnify:CR=1 FL=1
MTLKKWIEKNPKAYIETTQLGAKIVYAQGNKTVDLWHLNDFSVSSVVSGPAIILCPKKSV